MFLDYSALWHDELTVKFQFQGRRAQEGAEPWAIPGVQVQDVSVICVRSS